MAQSKITSVFTYQSWVHAVAGATGSVVAMTTFYPLDTVRYRLQVEDPERRKALSTWTILKQLVKEEGFESLYLGLVPVLQSLCISNFVYFYSFHSLKAVYGSNGMTGPIKDLLLGSIAGIINVLTTTPFWVVNTRLKMGSVTGYEKFDQYSNLCEGLHYIFRTDGIKGLWAGTIPSLMLVCNPAIQFTVYEWLKRVLVTTRNPSAFLIFTIGAMAKAFATVCTYPLQLIQTKLRHGDKNADLSPTAGWLDILKWILERHGVRGLFRGLEAKLLQTVLTAALMFVAYEKIVKCVMSLLIKNKK